MTKILGTYHVQSREELFLKLGNGEISIDDYLNVNTSRGARSLVSRLFRLGFGGDKKADRARKLLAAADVPEKESGKAKINTKETYVLKFNEKERNFSFADCCRPIPGDEVMGFINDDGEVVEYLNPKDWTGNIRDGSRGQVMIELPEHYRKFETDGTKRRVLISEYPITGYHLVRKRYVSAYEATVQRSTKKLCSVVNMDADYRGGNNNAEWDGSHRTLLGRPATTLSSSDFRNYARNRKANSSEWNYLVYDIYKDIYWLFVIEYATLNSQDPFNAKKTTLDIPKEDLGME